MNCVILKRNFIPVIIFPLSTFLSYQLFFSENECESFSGHMSIASEVIIVRIVLPGKEICLYRDVELKRKTRTHRVHNQKIIGSNPVFVEIKRKTAHFAPFSSGGWIRTNDLRVMSPTSYRCSTPHH